jgi:hypothetical protein
MERVALRRNYTEPDDAYDLVSVAAYQPRRGAKTDGKIAALTALVQATKKLLPDCFVRIHYDNSVRVSGTRWASVLGELSTDPIVQMVHYDSADFKNGHGYHSPALNEVMRYYPAFNPRGKEGTVFVADLLSSVPVVSDRNAKIMQHFQGSKSRVHFKTKACLHTTDRMGSRDQAKSPRFWQRMMTSFLMTKHKFPPALMDGFVREHAALSADDKQAVDDLFCNTLLLKEVDDSGVAFSYTLENDVHRIVQYAKPRDRGAADKMYSRILGTNAKNPHKALVDALQKSSGEVYLAIAQRLVAEYRAVMERGEYEKYGVKPVETECVLRHGVARSTEFVLEYRGPRGPFVKELKRMHPDAVVTPLDTDMKKLVKQVMDTPLEDGRMTLRELTQKLVTGEDTIYLKGGIVRDMLQGIMEFNDIDLAIHPVSVQLAAQRLKREFGESLAMSSSRSIPLVIIGKDRIDVTEADFEHCTWDATCNSLLIDPLQNTIIDPTGFGIADAKSKTYRFSCEPFSEYIAARGVPALWRLIKFGIRGYATVEAQRVQLYSWIYNDSEDTETKAWTILPFISNIPRDQAVEAFTWLKGDVDLLHASKLLDFDGGDMLLHLLQRGTLMAFLASKTYEKSGSRKR